MALPDFTIDLDNGTYIDNAGAVKTSRDDGKASFRLPSVLPVDGKELQKTFKAFQTIIPNLNKLGVFDPGELASRYWRRGTHRTTCCRPVSPPETHRRS